MLITKHSMQWVLLAFLTQITTLYVNFSHSLPNPKAPPVSLTLDSPPLPEPLDATTYWVGTCVYPVSGIYTRCQRILYFVVLVFAFCLRFHEWLTGAAWAFVITYSTTASIHGIIISLQRNIGRDSDHEALLAILGPTVSAAIIFAFYSPKVLGLRLKELFWGWAFILGIANLCLVLKHPSWLSNQAALVVKITCEKNWNCNNPCGNITTMNVLFRSSMTDSLQPIFFNIRDVENVYRRNSNKVWSVKIG